MKRNLLLALSFGFSFMVFAQQKITVKAEKEEIEIQVGETDQIKVVAFDESNKKLEKANFFFYSSNGKAFDVDEEGKISTFEPGRGRIIVVARMEGTKGFGRLDIPMIVKHASVEKVEILDLPSVVHSGVSMKLNISIVDAKGFKREDLSPTFASSNVEVATVDPLGNLQAYKKGKTEISVSVGSIVTSANVTVKDNPVSKLSLEAPTFEARTGDVIPFQIRAFDSKGKMLADIQPTFTFQGVAADASSYASGLIRKDGRFVADVAGLYTVSANYGNVTSQKSVKITQREVTRKVQLVGRGAVSNVHTSDLWVWEGVDGKDYAVTGTWGANGEAYFWDVTDPANMELVDTITVDARTVNDVKVSADGKICIISREGASNRKNGIVIIDVTNPRDAKIISTFDDGLTGGVHNLFIYEDHVFALSNGERYDIINIKDPKNPKKVSEFELEGPGHSIHDVWVMDGIAYSSNWEYGVFMVDVGNGMAGGTIENPKVIGSHAYPNGWNHAAFPYKDKKTGKFYIIGGDEAFPNGLYVEDNPTIPAGYLHFLDFTDIKNPEEVAKYEVPGAGSHNFWVDGDLLYVANYNAGLRIIDLSGDLLGDLYKQGREIAWFLPTDSKGKIPNAAMTWGPQPHKGHIFFSDWNSGLWAVKMEPEKPGNVKVESR